MKTELEQLLESGRKMLADKQAEIDRNEAHYRHKLECIHAGARMAALEMFAPLGATCLVRPTSPPPGWNPYYIGHNIEFSVRPFADSGPAICVKLRGASGKDRPDEPRDMPWTWEQESDHERYYVESQWSPDEECDHLYATSYNTTNSLAVALAMCERNGDAYRIAQTNMQQRKAAADLRAKERERRKTEPTAAEDLLDALENWILETLPGRE
jgi:hypothetical protein